MILDLKNEKRHSTIASTNLYNLIKDDLEKYIKSIGINLSLIHILQPEILPGQNILPIQVPKEHVEQWVLQAIEMCIRDRYRRCNIKYHRRFDFLFYI